MRPLLAHPDRHHISPSEHARGSPPASKPQAFIEALLRALIEALLGALIEALTAALIEALVAALTGALMRTAYENFPLWDRPKLRSAQPSAAQHSPAQPSTAQHSPAQLTAAQHSSAQLSTAQHIRQLGREAGAKKTIQFRSPPAEKIAQLSPAQHSSASAQRALLQALIAALIEDLLGTLIGALIGALIEALIDSLTEALSGATIEALVEALTGALMCTAYENFPLWDLPKASMHTYSKCECVYGYRCMDIYVYKMQPRCCLYISVGSHGHAQDEAACNVQLRFQCLYPSHLHFLRAHQLQIEDRRCQLFGLPNAKNSLKIHLICMVAGSPATN